MKRPLRPFQPRRLSEDHPIYRRARRVHPERALIWMWLEPRHRPRSPRWKRRDAQRRAELRTAIEATDFLKHRNRLARKRAKRSARASN